MILGEEGVWGKYEGIAKSMGGIDSSCPVRFCRLSGHQIISSRLGFLPIKRENSRVLGWLRAAPKQQEVGINLQKD
jgi:hypothetical protein